VRSALHASIDKMAFLTRALVAASCIASALAVDIVVQGSGGNLTGKFGRPYGYGFLHEVSELITINLSHPDKP